MDAQTAAWGATGVVLIVAALITFVWLSAETQIAISRERCVCVHRRRRHEFNDGRCFDCGCRCYVEHAGPKYI